MTIDSVRELMQAVREGKYADGGYPLFFFAHDGDTLCPDCVKKEIWQIARAVRDKQRNGWRVVGMDVNWEDPDMWCAHCNARIPSAYAEDEAAPPPPPSAA